MGIPSGEWWLWTPPDRFTRAPCWSTNARVKSRGRAWLSKLQESIISHHIYRNVPLPKHGFIFPIHITGDHTKKHRLKTKHSKMLWMMEQSYNFQVSKCSTYWGVLALDRSSTLEPCSGQIMAMEQAWGTNVPTRIRYLLPDTMWDLYNLNYESSSRFVVSYWFE